jgi:hypothetical protein
VNASLGRATATLLLAGLLLSVGPAAGRTGAVAAAGPTGTISGSVTAARTGAPLAGVCVLVGDNHTGAVTELVTDRAGRYRVTVAAGDHRVDFNACTSPLPGYAYERWEGVRAWGHSVTVEAGAHLRGIDAALEPAGTLRGTVRSDVDDRPLPDVCVRATSAGGSRDFVDAGVTGAEGTWSLPNLPPGGWHVRYLDCSPTPPRFVGEHHDDLPLAPTRAYGDTVRVRAGTETVVAASLRLGAAVTGTVRWRHTGAPVHDTAVLHALREDGRKLHPDPYEPDAVTLVGGRQPQRPYPPFLADVPGVYVFGGLEPGWYAVAVDGSMAGAATVFHDGAARLEETSGFRLRPGEVRVTDIDLSPRPSFPWDCNDLDPSRSWRPGSPHLSARLCLHRLGVHQGTRDGHPAAAALATRGQVASLLQRGLGSTLGVPLPAAPPDAFTDDDGSVHEGALNQLAAVGVVRGTAPGRVSPDAPVTRAQLAVLLVRAHEAASGLELRRLGDAFPDDDGHPHEHDVDRAAAAALVTGTADGQFRPAAPARRDQVVTAVTRLLGRANGDGVYVPR